jgi:hypothetical protein
MPLVAQPSAPGRVVGAAGVTPERDARKLSSRRRVDPEVRFAPIEAKLLAPASRAGLVVRKTLVNRLLAAASIPVVCLTARQATAKRLYSAIGGKPTLESGPRPIAISSSRAR